MNVFEAVKQSVTTRQAAEHYGIRVNRNGMACCPFHNDKTPSMKLDKRFHCFGCGADGDVIDFVAALYGLGKKEAAAQLASDFGLAYEDWKPPGRARKPKPRQKSPEEQFREAKAHCFRVLADYLHLLRVWKTDYAPHSPEEAFHPRFVEALQKQAHVEYLLDVLLFGETEEKAVLIMDYGKDVIQLEQRMAELAAADAARTKKHHERHAAAPVGLLPIAVAGFDIDKLVAGAADMEKACGSDVPFAENPAAIYAATRNELYRQGKKIEILVNFCPKLHYVSEWWKQLYGESEGKDNKGIFPASVDFSTDLHSMGQWIQEGERSIFETVISLDKVDHKLEVPFDEANLDGLNFLAGKRVDEVNKMAELGTQLAHVDGGVPNMRIVLPELSEYNIGGLLYFFEKACGISGYLLGVNPFNQPGVEAYKKNMFALLNKPGYEEESKAIQAKL